MQKKKLQEANEFYGDYGKAFNFTQGDLEANRAGFISFLQKQRSHLRLLLYISTALLSLFLFIWGIGIPTLNNGGSHIVVFLLTFCIFGFLTSILLPYLRNLLLDLREGKVKFAEGEAKVIDTTIKGEVWAMASINDKTNYELRPAQIEILKGKGRFSIYVMPRTKQIVSIEEILAK